MASGITVEKAWEAGSVDLSASSESGSRATSIEVPYIVRGASDEYAAAEAAFGNAESESNGLTVKTASLRERLGTDSWKVVIRYEKKSKGDDDEEDEEDDEPRWSFSSGGATQHIDMPLAKILTVQRPGLENITHPGVIEPDEDGRPRGVDIPVPMLRISEMHVLRDSKMNRARKLRLASYVGSINLREYKGFRPGELRFDGADFSDREDERGRIVWDVSLNFMFQPTQFHIDCGDRIVVPAKAGWDYLWKQVESVTRNGKVYSRVVAAYVDRLYPVKDFSALLS